MINKMKEVHTYGDVLNVLEEYEKEKKINEAWNNSETLYKTQYQPIRSSNVIGYISSFEEDTITSNPKEEIEETSEKRFPTP